MIKGHGDDVYQYQEVEGNFSSNVYHKGTDSSLSAFLCKKVSELSHYPEPNAESLVGSIASYHDVAEDRVLVTNGATEAFYLLANLFRHAKSLIFTPSFSEYEDACKCASHKIVYTSTEDFRELDFDLFDLVWICNPNNPDAHCYDAISLIEKIKENPSSIFIIDEAYIDFVDGVDSMVEVLNAYENLIVIRSMTKRYAMPALRLGYMLASPVIINKITKLLMPWRLNTLAIEAGKYVLSQGYKDDFDKEELLTLCRGLQDDLSRIETVEVLPSKASFFLAKSPMKASELKTLLMTNYKLLIRDASNFRGLSDYYFRVATQGITTNNLLVKAIREILSSC